MCDSYGHCQRHDNRMHCFREFFRDGKFLVDRSLSGQCSVLDRFSEQSSVRIQVQPGECFIHVVRWNQKQVYTLDWLQGMWRLVSSMAGIIFSSATVTFLRRTERLLFLQTREVVLTCNATKKEKKKTNFATLRLVQYYEKLHSYSSLMRTTKTSRGA